MKAGSLPARLTLACLTAGLALAAAGCGDDSGTTSADDQSSEATSASATAASPSPSTTSSDEATASPSASSAAAGQAFYEVGRTPQGPRLFAEYRPASGDAVSAAAAALGTAPDDPDYRTLWPVGSLTDAHLADTQIDVTVDSSLAQRPSELSAKEAKLALQQVVYTLQAAAGQKLPVQFLIGDAPAASVLGVSTTDPVQAADELSTLALVNVVEPAETQTVGSTFTASGMASTFEGTVPWTILDITGKVVLRGSAQTQGDYTSLTPWQADVDASKLQAGDYTFVASTGDAGEGPGPTTDSKIFTIS